VLTKCIFRSRFNSARLCYS